MSKHVRDLRPGDFVHAPELFGAVRPADPWDVWRIAAATPDAQGWWVRLHAESASRPGVVLDVVVSADYAVADLSNEDVEWLTADAVKRFGGTK